MIIWSIWLDDIRVEKGDDVPLPNLFIMLIIAMDLINTSHILLMTCVHRLELSWVIGVPPVIILILDGIPPCKPSIFGYHHDYGKPPYCHDIPMISDEIPTWVPTRSRLSLRSGSNPTAAADAVEIQILSWTTSTPRRNGRGETTWNATSNVVWQCVVVDMPFMAIEKYIFVSWPH